MKNVLKPILILFLVLIVTSCKKANYSINEEFTLDFKQTAIINSNEDDLKIKFIELVEESRCPPDAVCAWAGQVAIKISVDGNDEYILGIHLEHPSVIVHNNKTITLLGVTFDRDAHYGKEKYYSLKLKVG